MRFSKWGHVFHSNLKSEVIFLIIVFIAVVFVTTQGVLFASENPHSERAYPLDTDACAQCHRTHTAVSEHLVAQFFAAEECFTCHDGTGSSYNVLAEFTAVESHQHSIGGFNAGSTKQCASCHETHRADLLSVKRLIDPRNTRIPWNIVDINHATYDSTSSPSGIYMWCQTCHTDSAKLPVGSPVLTVESSETGYVPYDVQVTSLTPYSLVDNNGDTSTASYWQYFTGETTFDRFGYNDSSATGQSSHGRAILSKYAKKNMRKWKAPYEPEYPAMPCTDCHAKHGSKQPWMIVDSVVIPHEETVTGYDMKTIAGQRKFCEACHTGRYELCNLSTKCTNCHRHGRLF